MLGANQYEFMIKMQKQKLPSHWYNFGTTNPMPNQQALLEIAPSKLVRADPLQCEPRLKQQVFFNAPPPAMHAFSLPSSCTKPGAQKIVCPIKN